MALLAQYLMLDTLHTVPRVDLGSLRIVHGMGNAELRAQRYQDRYPSYLIEFSRGGASPTTLQHVEIVFLFNNSKAERTTALQSYTTVSSRTRM